MCYPKRSGASLQKIQGSARKTQGQRVDIWKAEGVLTSFPGEQVPTYLDRTIADQRLGFDLSASAREGARVSTDKRARAVSD